jgi:hypothetical protein
VTNCPVVPNRRPSLSSRGPSARRRWQSKRGTRRCRAAVWALAHLHGHWIAVAGCVLGRSSKVRRDQVIGFFACHTFQHLLAAEVRGHGSVWLLGRLERPRVVAGRARSDTIKASGSSLAIRFSAWWLQRCEGTGLCGSWAGLSDLVSSSGQHPLGLPSMALLCCQGVVLATHGNR